MSAPVTVVIRPGAEFEAAAARSFRRANAAWRARSGRDIDVNSTYREWALQLSMYHAWQAWVAGTGPKPNHSRAVHPDYSSHSLGLGLDSDDWATAGFIPLLLEHGWVRTAASDPTERHHFEYQAWRDTHRNDPAPAGDEEDDMYDDDKHRQVLTAARPVRLYKIGTGIIAVGTGGGFWILPDPAYIELLVAWELAGPNIVARAIDQNELDTMRKVLATLNPGGDGAARAKVDAVLALSVEDVQRLASAITDEHARRLAKPLDLAAG